MVTKASVTHILSCATHELKFIGQDIEPMRVSWPGTGLKNKKKLIILNAIFIYVCAGTRMASQYI
jgi:hypothetical protein